MNESGIAVRKVLAREHAPLNDMLVVSDDFALPFGKLRFREGGSAGGHNGLRSIIGELGNEKFSRLRVGIGEPGRNSVDHVLSRFHPSEKRAARRAARRRRRRGRGVGARGHEPRREPIQPVRAAPGRRGPGRAAGRGRRAARCRRDPSDADRLAQGPRRRGPRVSPTPLRGKPVGSAACRRPGDRRSERTTPGRCRAPRARGPRFDVAEVDAEVEDVRRGRAPGRDGDRRGGRRRGRRCRATPIGAAASDPRAGPPAARPVGPAAAARTRSGAFARPSPPARCRPDDAPPVSGRHAGLTNVPHGAKTYLAAALARRAERGAARLDRARRRDRRPRRRGAAGLAGRARRGRRAGAADGARLRAQRARAGRERGPGRGAGGVASRAAPASWSRASRRCSSTRSTRRTCRSGRGCSGRRPRVSPDAAAAPAVRPRLRAGVRGRRPRRVRAARRHHRRVPAGEHLPRPHRVLRRRDRLDPQLRPDRPADDRQARPTRSCCRRANSCCRRRGRRHPGATARHAARSASASRPTSNGSGRRRAAAAGAGGAATTRRELDPDAPRTRAIEVGDAAEVWAAILAPATGLDHIAAGDAARARRTRRHRRSRRIPLAPGRRAPRGADRKRRTAEGLAGDVSRAARLEGPARRVADPRADLGVRGVRRDGRRRPVRWATPSAGTSPALPAGRARQIAQAVDALDGREGARSFWRRTSRPASAELLAEAGRRGRRRQSSPRGAAARRRLPRSSAASTAASPAGPTASSSSRTASSSAPSASVGRARFDASSRATSWSG